MSAPCAILYIVKHKATLPRAVGILLICVSAAVMLYKTYEMLFFGLVRVTSALMLALFVCAPLIFGTLLLCRAEETDTGRRRVVRTALFSLFLFYLLSLLLALIVSRIDFANYPAQRASYLDHLALMTNFTPFATVMLYVRAIKYNYIGMATPLSNLIGNVLLFMPMAFFLPCLYESMRTFWKFLLLMTAVLTAVEALQLLLCCGSCDVDDVLLNLIGSLAVYALASLPPVKRLLRRLYLLPLPSAPADMSKP